VQELRIARAKAGMTLMELEAASGVGASTISKIERGVTQPQANTLHKLADGLGVEVGELYPKAQAPLFQELPKREHREERRVNPYDVALDAARRQAVQDRQATARAVESGRAQAYWMRHENEAVVELLKYPADELAGALLEATRRCVELENERDAEATADLEAKLERLEQENAQLKEGDMRMRQENARLRQDLAEYRAEAEREEETAQ
jgi:transcriptional regulator with XRE-family HTH domain